MNQVDKISKEVLNLLNYSKDVTTTNLNSANKTGKLEPRLTDDQLRLVVNLVESSLTQGYQKGLNTFQKTIKNTLETKKVTVEETKKNKK
jgi:hypothetical protein